MLSRARIAKHPVHPMLITLPIGMWVFALVSQIVYFNNGDLSWRTAATYAMAGGVISAVLAAIAGFIELFAIPPSRVRTIAIWHMTLNLTIAAIFAVAFSLNMADSPNAALILAVIGVSLLLASGWLGWTMVYIYHMGVVERGQPKREEPVTRERVGV
ncbi:MAG: DUF2231 domain-containing protein [Candidatus Latescibacterota bacterium]